MVGLVVMDMRQEVDGTMPAGGSTSENHKLVPKLWLAQYPGALLPPGGSCRPKAMVTDEKGRADDRLRWRERTLLRQVEW